MLKQAKVLILATAVSFFLAGCANTAANSSADQETPVYGNKASFLPDPVSDVYVKRTFDSVNLPVGVLRPAEPMTEKSIQSAQNVFDKRDAGLSSRIMPLNVIYRGDGSFSIIDGSSAYSLLKSKGAKAIPVKINYAYSKNVKAESIDDLYQKNEDVKTDFINKVEQIHKMVGGELIMRQSPKSKERVEQKTQNVYKGDYRGVTDLLAGRIVFDTGDEILHALNVVKDLDYVVQFHDRWNHPTSAGYRDAFILIIAGDGVLGELQFSHSGIIKMVDFEHKLYEFYRSHRDDPAFKEATAKSSSLQRTLLQAAVENMTDKVFSVKTEIDALCEKLVKTKDNAKAVKIMEEMEGLLQKAGVNPQFNK